MKQVIEVNQLAFSIILSALQKYQADCTVKEMFSLAETTKEIQATLTKKAA